MGSVSALVAALAGAGVCNACICPGSRSTPLALALAADPRIKVWMHLDERSAAFFGLGLARAAREPVALLATSGTAAANFLPAVVEARLSRVPLIVLTADRPHELRDNGAPQTIDQLRLYGEHVKWFFDLPEPELDAQQGRVTRALGARAVATAMANPAGPVHLNWPFREPFIAETPADGLAHETSIAVQQAQLAPSSSLLEDLAAAFQRTERGLIVVGPQDDPELAPAIARVARRVGHPILADALSGLRNGPHDRELVINTYDAFLRDATTASHLEPELVVRIGAIPTSKPLQQYLQRWPSARHILIDPADWRDPLTQVTDVLRVDPRLLFESLFQSVSPSPTRRWRELWWVTDAGARIALDRQLASSDELFEGRAFAELGELLPDGALIYAGNSMPVRDLDTFLSSSEKDLRCLANRGANGIDGVVSSALGASAVHDGPVVLAIGDISFYHDMNGLLAARRHALDLLVVLLNNDGGGIFSFLPQAETSGDEFELLFGTPNGLDFRPFVEGYGGHFVRVHDWPAFRDAVQDGLRRGGLQVVEVPTDRRRNVTQHRAVWRAVAEALSPAPVA